MTESERIVQAIYRKLLDLMNSGSTSSGAKVPGSVPILNEFPPDTFDAVPTFRHYRAAVRRLKDEGIVSAKPGKGKTTYYWTGAAAPNLNTLATGRGYAATCSEQLTEFGLDRVRRICYKENWLDTAGEGLLNLEDQLRSLIDSGKEADLKFILMNPDVVLTRALRLAGTQKAVVDHCARVRNDIAQNPKYSHIFDARDYPAYTSLVNACVLVDAALVESYGRLKHLAARASERSQGKVSLEVCCSRAWQPFPSLIVNSDFAVIGFYSSQDMASKSDALIVRKGVDGKSPMLDMAIKDFEVIYAMSVPMFASKTRQVPTWAEKPNETDNVFESRFYRDILTEGSEVRRDERIRKRVEEIIQNFAMLDSTT